MVKAWVLDNDAVDRRLPNMTEPPRYFSPKELFRITGIKYFQVDANNFETDDTLKSIRKERGYDYQDVIEVTKSSPNYQEMVTRFYKEHLHADEEIRLVLDGCGYFDVRDVTDTWVRIQIDKGDMVILPAGIYHRFTLDPTDYIKLGRYFSGTPVWEAHYRPADDMPCRKEYQKLMDRITAGDEG